MKDEQKSKKQLIEELAKLRQRITQSEASAAEPGSTEKLEESEQRFREVVQSIGEGLLITDLQDVIQFANDRIIELFGYSKKEMIGQRAYELFLPKDEWPLMLQRNESRMSGVSERYELQMKRKDGDRFWLEINATPYRNVKGEIVGTLGALTDITDRKRMEQDLIRIERLRALGEMARGVAHNFKTSWSACSGLRN